MRIASISILLGVLVWASPSQAACGGSSPIWAAASPSQSDIEDCIDAASNGDTINVPAGGGTVSWGSINLSPGKGLSLIGPGANNLTVRNSTVEMHCSTGRSHRLSGFAFDGSGTQINVYGTCADFRIDNNVFTNFGGDVLDINTYTHLEGPLYGLIDNNTFTLSGGNERVMNIKNGGIGYA